MKKLPFILLCLIFTSCAAEFTSTMKKEIENSNINLNKIQFYNSREFCLQRELTSSETGLAKGKIKFKEGKKIEIVKFPTLRPSVCDSSFGNTLYIIFEHGKDKKIPFICDQYNNFYSLVTSGNSDIPLSVKNYTAITGLKFYGTIIYDGKEYYYGYSSKPKLKVKKSQIQKVLKEKRIVDGIRIK